MDIALKEKIIEQLEKQKNHVGFYYENLVSGEKITYKADKQVH